MSVWNLAFIASLLSLVGCGGSSDLLPLEDYEKVEVVPFFFFEGSDQHIELQTVKGATNCRIAARAFAASKKVERTKWGYVCFTTDGKHKIR